MPENLIGRAHNMNIEEIFCNENTFHEHYMRMALREAAAAAEEGEVPTGCVIISKNPDTGETKILGKAHNMTETLKDPSAHAEMLAITQAAEAVGDWRITDSVLYVTKEPCPMCAGAIVLARIPFVVWGTDDPKRGGETVFSIMSHDGINHHPQILRGICADECLSVLQTFFKTRRGKAE